jgi:hypothetical protein
MILILSLWNWLQKNHPSLTKGWMECFSETINLRVSGSVPPREGDEQNDLKTDSYCAFLNHRYHTGL